MNCFGEETPELVSAKSLENFKIFFQCYEWLEQLFLNGHFLFFPGFFEGTILEDMDHLYPRRHQRLGNNVLAMAIGWIAFSTKQNKVIPQR